MKVTENFGCFVVILSEKSSITDVDASLDGRIGRCARRLRTRRKSRRWRMTSEDDSMRIFVDVVIVIGVEGESVVVFLVGREGIIWKEELFFFWYGLSWISRMRLSGSRIKGRIRIMIVILWWRNRVHRWWHLGSVWLSFGVVF